VIKEILMRSSATMMLRYVVGVMLVLAMADAATAQQASADLIITNGRIATMNKGQPSASAVAIKDGKFVAVGTNEEALKHRGDKSKMLDAKGRTVIPGLIDSHLHAIRAGRFYNLELRWDGVPTLKQALTMLRDQAKRTPKGQWVRVIGGWSPFQFEERRLPTPQELTEAAPDTPVLVLFLYSRGYLNRAGVESLSITKETKAPAGGRYEVSEHGAVLVADPNPTILYQAIAKLPELGEADKVNSTRYFYRELNRFGLTGVIDAGGGGQQFAKDYAVTKALAEKGELPIRLSFYLFPQTPGEELQSFKGWTRDYKSGQNWAKELVNGYTLEGGGETLIWAAGDFENFMAERPVILDSNENREKLAAVMRHMIKNRWTFRIHATYDESLAKILDVLETVNSDTPLNGLRWFFDHAETASLKNIRRIKALGGGVAVQNRMAYAGELFKDRYGKEAAAAAPPLRQLLDAGIPLGAGTDGTRVTGYNPWGSLAWMVTGKTLGGTQLHPKENRLTREEALRLYTVGSAWFSGDEDKKGVIAPGRLADLAVLSADYFTVPEGDICNIEAVLTIVGGKVVYGSGEFEKLVPSPPPVSPDWSPVKTYGGYYSRDLTPQRKERP
jgi:predicted amidohydrolase YtcJ